MDIGTHVLLAEEHVEAEDQHGGVGDQGRAPGEVLDRRPAAQAYPVKQSAT